MKARHSGEIYGNPRDMADYRQAIDPQVNISADGRNEYFIFPIN